MIRTRMQSACLTALAMGSLGQAGLVFPQEDCCNHVDDDLDGRIDFDDTDCGNHPECEVQRFHRGDVDDNGTLDVTDAVRILNVLFGSLSNSCLEAMDTDGNGEITVTDAVRILRYLFAHGEPPASPGAPGEPCAEPSLIGCAFNLCNG